MPCFGRRAAIGAGTRPGKGPAGDANRMNCGGEVIFNGAWIAKSEYERLVSQEENAAEIFAKRKKSSKSAASSMSPKARLALRRKIEAACHKD